jgi:ribonuclease VapC
MMVVLDASALLAWFFGEPGSERIDQALVQGAVIHTVNWAEVLSKLAERGLDPEEVETDLNERGVLMQALNIEAGQPSDARTVARLRPLTRTQGLSLGDRYCLALGQRLGVSVLTADRAWAALDLGITVEVIQ